MPGYPSGINNSDAVSFTRNWRICLNDKYFDEQNFLDTYPKISEDDYVALKNLLSSSKNIGADNVRRYWDIGDALGEYVEGVKKGRIPGPEGRIGASPSYQPTSPTGYYDDKTINSVVENIRSEPDIPWSIDPTNSWDKVVRNVERSIEKSKNGEK